MVQDERCTRFNHVHRLCFCRTVNLILGAADCQARLSMQDLGSESGAGGGAYIAARAASYSRVLLHCLYWSTLLLRICSRNCVLHYTDADLGSCVATRDVYLPGLRSRSLDLSIAASVNCAFPHRTIGMCPVSAYATVSIRRGFLHGHGVFPRIPAQAQGRALHSRMCRDAFQPFLCELSLDV